MVINNLQEHSAKQEHATYRHFAADDSVSNILRSGGGRTRHASNRSIPTSVRSSQTQRKQQQQQQHAFVAGRSTSSTDSTLEEKRQRRPPTWLGIADPSSSYCAPEECTCPCCCCGGGGGSADGAATTTTTTGSKISGVLSFDAADSVLTGETADVRACCPGMDCRHWRGGDDIVGLSSRPTMMSPCCSHLGATTAIGSFRSPVAETEDGTEVETDLLNSADFSALSYSAPDLFTITRHAKHLLDATDNNRLETA